MENDKKKKPEKDQETTKPTGGKKEDLQDKDLENVSGGGWIDVNKF